jgi:hypothetical protein
MVGKRGRSLRERFENFYIPEPNTGCWLWTGSIHHGGYGQMWSGVSGPAKAHHVSYRLHKGEIPPGLWVRHKCDVRSCVNPDHLEVGTAQDNVDDAVRRDRHSRGERFWAARLTEQQVLAIRADPRKGQHAAIARDYGVTPKLFTTSSRVASGKHPCQLHTKAAPDAPSIPPSTGRRAHLDRRVAVGFCAC